MPLEPPKLGVRNVAAAVKLSVEAQFETAPLVPASDQPELAA